MMMMMIAMAVVVMVMTIIIIIPTKTTTATTMIEKLNAKWYNPLSQSHDLRVYVHVEHS